MAKDIKIQPLGLRVVVKPQEQEEKTAGGLYVPPTAQEDKKPEMGVVVKLGTGEKGDDAREFEVKEGDMIFFKGYSPDSIDVDGEEFLVVHQDDIIAVVK